MLKGVEGVMKGYRPQVDWGGEGGFATIMVGRHNVHVATSGWRKRCLFLLLVALLLLSLFNLLLTIWILRRISFNAEGAGDLHVLIGGLKLEGAARIDHKLTASKIESRSGEDINIIGYNNVSAITHDGNGTVSSMLYLDSKGLLAASKSFNIHDSKGNLLFATKGKQIEVGAKFLTVGDDDNSVIEADALQTPRLLGDNVHEFLIESQTRSLEGSAKERVRIEARDGDVVIIALKDEILRSKKGIRIESNVLFSSIPDGNSTNMKPSQNEDYLSKRDTQIPPPILEPVTVKPIRKRNAKTPKTQSTEEDISVYQVCVCHQSGRLFLTSETICRYNETICQ